MGLVCRLWWRIPLLSFFWHRVVSVLKTRMISLSICSPTDWPTCCPGRRRSRSQSNSHLGRTCHHPWLCITSTQFPAGQKWYNSHCGQRFSFSHCQVDYYAFMFFGQNWSSAFWCVGRKSSRSQWWLLFWTVFYSGSGIDHHISIRPGMDWRMWYRYRFNSRFEFISSRTGWPFGHFCGFPMLRSNIHSWYGGLQCGGMW